MTLFNNESDADRTVLICPSDLNAQAADEFKALTKNLMLSPASLFVLDCRGTNKISRDFYQMLIQFKTTIKKADKDLITLNLRDSLVDQLKIDGMTHVFTPLKALPPKQQPKEPAAKKSALNVSFINPFLNAVAKTLEVQCATIVKAGKPSLKTEFPENIALASILQLSSNGFNGSIILCFPETVFLKIYENMFGEQQTAINDETQDAAAEMLNIIYGLAKVELNKAGHSFATTLPTVLVGEKIKIRQSGKSPAVQIPFETAFGTFIVGIEFNQAIQAA